MAIVKRDEGRKVNSNINVTPMVDVMLVLLIIFMVISPVTPKGLDALVAQPQKPGLRTQPQITIQPKCNALADPPQLAHRPPFRASQRRLHGA